jgi:pimeloyl-ACP methyl ester carboxylesterase
MAVSSSIVSRIAHGSAGIGAAPYRDPWWEHLDAGFWRIPERFELSLRDRCQVGATAFSDVVIRTLGASLVGALAVPTGYGPRRLLELARDRGFYESLANGGDPGKFFEAPPARVPVERRPARWPYFRPKAGTCEDLCFRSPFEPVNPWLRRAYRLHRANGIAHARHWRHLDGPRPTIVALHGFSADLHLLNEWFFALPWFYKLGCDILLVTLPFHGRRQTRFSPFSGHGFFAGGVARINEAFAQAVFDFRIFFDHLQARGVERIGVTGVSLGGYTAALLAAVDPRLQFALPNVPLVSLPDLVLEWHPLSLGMWAAMLGMRVTLPQIRHMLAAHSPLTYRPLLSRERLMIIGGVGDRLAPPKHARLLWEHWGRCRIHWFPGSHLLHFDKGEYLKQTASFLADLGFVPRR